jgi:hypothetical protein
LGIGRLLQRLAGSCFMKRAIPHACQKMSIILLQDSRQPTSRPQTSLRDAATHSSVNIRVPPMRKSRVLVAGATEVIGSSSWWQACSGAPARDVQLAACSLLVVQGQILTGSQLAA